MAIIKGSCGHWFNTDRLTKKNRNWKTAFVVGARGVGKTFWMQKKLFDDYELHGERSLWIRNFEKHMTKPSFYLNFLNGPIRMGMCHNDYFVDGDGVFTDKSKEECVCLFTPIERGGQKFKGNEYTGFTNAFSDEFMLLDGEQYPRNCTENLGLILGSLRSNLKCVVLASNFTNITNPYWAAMRIYPERNYGVTDCKHLNMIEVCEPGYYNTDMQDTTTGLGWTINQLMGGREHSSPTEYANYELIMKKPIGHLQFANLQIQLDHQRLLKFYADSGDNFMYVVTRHPTQCERQSTLWVANPTLQSSGNMLLSVAKRNDLKLIVASGNCRFDSANTLADVFSLVYKAE
jgi:hypothetical protein